MCYVFNKTRIGYSHLKSKKPCQDYSASYVDNERAIITCCDGHGGPQYVRSQIGSKAASDAVINVFKAINKSFFFGAKNDQLVEKIKLLILCEYNKLIEREVTNRPIRKNELIGLSEEQIDTLIFNPAKAYGTTLSGAMLFGNKLVVVAIGDTEALGISKGQIIKIFDNSNDPAGNITYSMCQEDAFQYLRVAILDSRKMDGIFLCTDGLLSPYQTYDNFTKSFLMPTVKRIIETKTTEEVNTTITRIASELGVGDDVSLSFIINKKTNKRYYR